MHVASEAQLNFLGGDGEIEALIRNIEWSATPLGPIASWPQSLRIAVGIILGSRYPMFLWWGQELTLLYNQAYARMTLASKHPWALGRSAREVWAEIWPEIGPRVDEVMQKGRATWDEELLLILERNGFAEETYHTFSYSPIPDDEGGIGGIICPVTEETKQVLSRRRLRTLRELAARTSVEARSVESACHAAVEILAQNPNDLVFALIYLLDADGERAQLAGATGLPEDSPARQQTIALAEAHEASWPLATTLQSTRADIVNELTARFGALPGNVWPEPPQNALVLPILQPNQVEIAGFLVVGLSPRLSLDEDYRGFLELTAGHIGAAIANAQAYEAERQRAEALAELDRAKTTFFNNISHEFRTPLTLMLGPLAESLAEGPEAERQRLEVAYRNGLRLQKLVNTLLDFSRIEAGRIRANFVPTDLAALTRDLASVFRSAVEKAGLRLLVDCPPLPELIYVDHDKWEQIVLNLVSNAFKFTLEGEIEVALRDAGDGVSLSVRDTGSGISAEQLPHIFERFHRIEGTRARTLEGTGIGLAFVSELANLHGGTVTVESIVNQGSTFRVTVPKGKAHLPPEHVHEIEESAAALVTPPHLAVHYVEEALRWLPTDNLPAENFPDIEDGLLPPATEAGSRARIVLADDNADMRGYVRRLLAGHYAVESVADGEAALAAVRREPPDLLLADVMMPRLDGFALLQAIRADDTLKTLPVILLSARAGEEAKVEGLGAGADDYLVKPFGARELLARVAAQLQLAQVRRVATSALAASEMRYRALAHATSNVLYRLNAEGTQFLDISDRSQPFMLESPQPVAVWLEQIHPDEREAVRAAWQKALETQTPYEFEHRVAQADGSWNWMLSRAVPVFDEAGKTVEWIGSTTNISARKQTEEAVRASEERLRLAIAAGNIFTWEVDIPTGKVTYSDNAEEVLGFALSASADGDRFFLHPDDRDRAFAEYQRGLRGETDYNAEYRFISTRTGEEVWVRSHGHLLQSPDGGAPRFLGITQNISERKRAEVDLRRRAEEFQAHFNLTAVGNVQAHAENGRFLLVNRAMCEMTGYSEAELLGRTIWDITAPQDRAENERLFAELVSGQRDAFELEKRFIRKDGETRWGVVSVTIAQRDETGRPVRTGSTVLDITRRKQIEEALRSLNEMLEWRVAERTAQARESEERFRALVAASAQIVWTMDSDGRVVEDSSSWREFTGRTFEQSKGWGWIHAIHPDERGDVMGKWRRAVAASQPMESEFRVRHHSGEWHWMQVRAVPLFDEQGAARGWVGMNIDIHERKQAEADRERLSRSLLMAEQEERRRISQALHDDLQQLLYATQMRITMVSQDLQRMGQQNLLEEIEEARAWLRQCIDTTRQMTVDLSPPILKNEGLADALEWLRPQMARRHGLKVEIIVADSFRIGDPDLRALLFQIVRELLFNVAKHAGVDQATVELRREDGLLTIHVIDQGQGFEARATGAARQQKGGYGLFSVQERLRLVGGQIEIRSQLGAGTHVVVRVPLQAEGKA